MHLEVSPQPRYQKVARIILIPNYYDETPLKIYEIPMLQDTCVALQALSEYAILSYVGGVNLTISLASTNLDFQETFELQRDNKKILQKAVVNKSLTPGHPAVPAV